MAGPREVSHMRRTTDESIGTGGRLFYDLVETNGRLGVAGAADGAISIGWPHRVKHAVCWRLRPAGSASEKEKGNGRPGRRRPHRIPALAEGEYGR